MARGERLAVSAKTSADATAEDNLRHVKGKGGVFKATAGLAAQYGNDRVFQYPLGEASIGRTPRRDGTRGLKPWRKFSSSITLAGLMQIRDEFVVMRWRSNGAFKAPVVIRVAIGGYLTGGGVYHSQSGESDFTTARGLRVVMPSTGWTSPVFCAPPSLRLSGMFLEHKHLYRQPYNRFGASRRPILRFRSQGPHGERGQRPQAIITYGAVVHQGRKSRRRNWSARRFR